MSAQFLDSIREWQKPEDEIIQLMWTTMEMISHDSGKHRVIQQRLIESLAKEALHMSH